MADAFFRKGVPLSLIGGNASPEVVPAVASRCINMNTFSNPEALFYYMQMCALGSSTVLEVRSKNTTLLNTMHLLISKRVQGKEQRGGSSGPKAALGGVPGCTTTGRHVFVAHV